MEGLGFRVGFGVKVFGIFRNSFPLALNRYEGWRQPSGSAGPRIFFQVSGFRVLGFRVQGFPQSTPPIIADGK